MGNIIDLTELINLFIHQYEESKTIRDFKRQTDEISHKKIWI